MLLNVWIFYSETRIADRYSISESEMVYYLLFALIVVPFNLTNEFMFYNVLDCYKDVEVVGYLKKKNEAFKKRKIF